MPEARVNGCTLYYELTGTGPPVVFIHGEDHGIEEFEEQLPYFAPRYRCLAYYRRGHGKSASVPFGYSLWQQTLDLAGLLDHLELQDVAIVSIGMGNPVAVSYALRHSRRVRGLALSVWFELQGYPAVEAHLRFGGESFCTKHVRMAEIARDQGAEGLQAFIEREPRLFSHLPQDPALRKRVAQLTASHPPAHYVQAAEFYLSIPDLVEEMPRLTCPILGICGTRDPAPDPVALMRNVPSFREAWIQDAGRFALLEQPAEFNRILDSFLGGLTC